MRDYLNTIQNLLLGEMSAGAQEVMDVVPGLTAQFRKVLREISHQFMSHDHQYL